MTCNYTLNYKRAELLQLLLLLLTSGCCTVHSTCVRPADREYVHIRQTFNRLCNNENVVGFKPVRTKESFLFELFWQLS